MNITQTSLMCLESELKKQTGDRYGLRYQRVRFNRFMIRVKEEHEKQFRRVLNEVYDLTGLYHLLHGILATAPVQKIEKYYIKDLEDGDYEVEKIEYEKDYISLQWGI